MTRFSRPQLPLDLGHRPALGGEDFLVAACNEEAVAWLDRWPEWPAPALALHGPAGCGKTHLAHVFAARTGAPILAASALIGLDPVSLLDEHRAVVVDDGETLADEPLLFHLFNAAKAAGKHLLLTGRQPPNRWPLTLPDLRSRLASIPAVAIAMPDDALIAALIVKLFADRQLRIGQDALTYLLGRMERSFAAARDLVERADKFSLSTRRPITLPLLREVLEGAG